MEQSKLDKIEEILKESQRWVNVASGINTTQEVVKGLSKGMESAVARQRVANMNDEITIKLLDNQTKLGELICEDMDKPRIETAGVIEPSGSVN